MSLGAFMKNNSGYIGKNMRTNLIIGGLFIVAALIIAAFFLSPAGRALLDRFSLLPRTERTSTLYFNENKLPTDFTVGKQLTPEFTIENHERRVIDYTYDIMQDNEILISGSATIDDGAKQEIKPDVILGQTNAEKTKLTITIRYTTGSSEKNSPSQTRSIFIWLTNKEESAYDDPNQPG